MQAMLDGSSRRPGAEIARNPHAPFGLRPGFCSTLLAADAQLPVSDPAAWLARTSPTAAASLSVADTSD